MACGVVGMYLLLAIQTTSWLRRRLKPTVWRTIHLMSYGVLALTTVHLLAAGTDVREMIATGVAIAIGITVTMLAALAWAIRSDAAAEERLERLDRMERLAHAARSNRRATAAAPREVRPGAA